MTDVTEPLTNQHSLQVQNFSLSLKYIFLGHDDFKNTISDYTTDWM